LRVITANGGMLEDERLDVETGRPFRRYWIDLNDSDQ
jgi:predicted acetyltransferase